MAGSTDLVARLQSIDVTDIVDFSRKVGDIGSLNKMMAPVYLRDFIVAFDITGSALARAVQCDIEAKSELERVEAIAYLDRSGDYLKNRGLKDSVEARKMYVQTDPDVLAAADVKARTEAMVALLKNKIQMFRMAHDTLKKIAYGSMEQSGYEGF